MRIPFKLLNKWRISARSGDGYDYKEKVVAVVKPAHPDWMSMPFHISADFVPPRGS